MKSRIDIADVATAAVLALGFASAMLSIKMAAADELVAGGIYDDSAEVSVGTLKEGQDLGQRNGALIAGRVYKKLIAKKGCEALAQYQDTLSLVASNVTSPEGEGSQFTSGFFQGYLSAIDQAVKTARTECGEAIYNDGAYPGELAANVFCQAADQDSGALALLSFAPIYDGWAANQGVKDQCAAAFQATASGCASTGIAAELLTQTQNAVCN